MRWWMKILTVADIIAATETTVALPGLSALLGLEAGVRVRKIGRAEYLALLPVLPPGSESWLAEEWPEKEGAWIATLPFAQLEQRRAQARDVLYRVAVTACVQPTLTLEQARHLGDDAAELAAEVLKFSGLIKPVPVVEEAAPVVVEEAEPVAA